MTDPPSGLRHLPASVTSRMSTHTHNDKPTARTETSADIRRLTYAGTHTTRATLRSSPRHTPPSAADRSPCTGVSSGMLNRPSPAIRITYSKHETAAIPPHIARAGNFLVMRDRNTLESATHPACRTALRANRHKTRENRYDYGSHTAPAASIGRHSQYSSRPSPPSPSRSPVAAPAPPNRRVTPTR